MNHSDRLAEIAKLYDNLNPMFKTVSHNADVLYLLTRVKVLTEALEFYASIGDALACGECIPDGGDIARKALGDE